MEGQSNKLVLKAPLGRRLFLIFILLPFVALSVSSVIHDLNLRYAMMTLPDGMISDTGAALSQINSDIIISVVFTVFLGIASLVLIIMPRTILIADTEGIERISLLKRFRKKILWKSVDRIDIAKQVVKNHGGFGSSHFEHLAIYYKKNHAPLLDQLLGSLASNTMSDGAGADLYISLQGLSGKIAIEKLQPYMMAHN